MFIVSYYSDKKLSDELSRKRGCEYIYERSNDWYRFVFVDGNFTNVQNDDLKRELIRKHTYARWAGGGSLYGMSRYSLVLLCDESDDSDDSEKMLKQHINSIYYQMAMIVLFQRAMLLKFAEDLDELIKEFKVGRLSEPLQRKAEKLHGDFIKFINKYWFIEVTPQEQGIEMYNQWLGLVGLDKL